MSRRENGMVPLTVPEPVCQPPRWLRRAVIALAVLAALQTIGLGLGAVYIYQQQMYIQGRGEYRDREAARMEAESQELIRRAMCDLLDQLPEGGLLERPRLKYGCGPGIPLSLLTPEEQARVQAGRATAPPAPASGPAPSLAGGASAARQEPSPGPAPERPEFDPAAPTPAPEPEPAPPLVDVGPVIDPVCDAVGVCPP